MGLNLKLIDSQKISFPDFKVKCTQIKVKSREKCINKMIKGLMKNSLIDG